jgi:hypothetical protein
MVCLKEVQTVSEAAGIFIINFENSIEKIKVEVPSMKGKVFDRKMPTKPRIIAFCSPSGRHVVESNFDNSSWSIKKSQRDFGNIVI